MFDRCSVNAWLRLIVNVDDGSVEDGGSSAGCVLVSACTPSVISPLLYVCDNIHSCGREELDTLLGYAERAPDLPLEGENFAVLYCT